MKTDYRVFVSLFSGSAKAVLEAHQNNKSPIVEIIQNIERIKVCTGLPTALLTMIQRIYRLAELIVLDETPMQQGLIQLSGGITKMVRILNSLSENQSTETVDPAIDGDDQSDAVPAPGTLPAAPADLLDLFAKFGQQLAVSLEDFEMYALEFEKGASEALYELKRLLHTWKGEFGVLDVRGHVQLIHGIEEKIVTSGTISTDELLRMKDILADAAGKMRAGYIPLLPEEYVTATAIKSEAVANEPPASQQSTTTTDVVTMGSDDDEIGDAVDKGLLADFITEAHDHIHRAETLLLELEIDPSKNEHINTIFRACHTIKGVAGFLSLKKLTRVAHSTENLMDLIRKGTLVLTSGRIDLLFEAMDCLKEMITAIAGSLEGVPYHTPESAHYVIKQLEQSEKDEPPSEIQLPQAEKKVGELLVERGAASEHQIESALRKQADGDSRPIGEILIDQHIPPKMIGKALAEQTKAKLTTGEIEDTIRVPIKRLDTLIDAIGEGVIAQSMVYANSAVAGLKDLALEKKIAQSMLIMRQIQEMSMSLRMVALRSTFQKMARLVRDLSKKVGKEVEFVMEGEDTELDKSVVENIGDPLIHMLRNSLDHGIESLQERRASGKSERAKITLRAYHKAGNVCVEIEDDGRGLNRKKIRSKAVERGLCKEDEAIDDNTLYQFIFMPGFSTAAVVTDISGRGVGMDVVQRNISSLRGAIDIQSEEGRGTLFTIRLPLTLAIISGMIVRLGNERYIVPTLSILESILPEKHQIETVVGKGELLKVRGELVRLIRLEQLFFGTGKSAGKSDTDGVALVVEDAMGRKVALFVDEIIDQQQVVIKNLGEGLGEIPGVSGGAIMSDGTISLILDVAGIVKIAAE